MIIEKGKYLNISYPFFLGHKVVLWIWKKCMCKRGHHLLDECLSPPDHYLYCDACGLSIHIDYVETEDK